MHLPLRRARALGSVGNLSLALYHTWQRDQIWVLVTVYIDESGTHDTEVMTLGGLAGRLGQWVSFDEKWRRLLAKNEVPYFRLKPFKHGEKPFRGWDDRKKNRFINKASRTIHRNTLFGFTVALKASDYRALYLTEEQKPAKVRFDSKYGLCFRMCLSMVPKLVQAALPQDEIDLYFVLEDGHKNFGDAKRVFDEVKEGGPPEIAKMLRTITPGKKLDFPGLQGADIPAHLSFRSESDGNPPIIPIATSHQEVLASKTRLSSAPIFRHLMTPENLREARQNAMESRHRKRNPKA